MTRLLIAAALMLTPAPAVQADSKHKNWSQLESVSTSVPRPSATSTVKDGTSNTLKSK